MVGGVLVPGHPCQDVSVLLVSELFGNSVQHSRSGGPGEAVTVTVLAGDGVVRVEVTDRCGLGVTELRYAGGDAEGVPLENRIRLETCGSSSVRRRACTR